MDNDDSIVCNKHNIILRRNKNSKTYSLDFKLQNTNINLKNIINFKLYELIAELNKDVVEKIEVINTISDTVIDLLFVFKRFGKELGIGQKYMVLRSIYEKNISQVRILSHSIPYDKTIINYQLVNSNYANLAVYFSSDHEANVKYTFNIDLDEELPSYMENIIGLLMKKIFYRVKIFIEKIN